jgi:hypothetical protein
VAHQHSFPILDYQKGEHMMFSIRNTAAKPTSTPSQLPAAGGYVALFITILLLLLGSAAAWITHVIVCIHHAAWVLLLFGCFVAPVGVIHGIGVWMGVF